MQQADIKTLKRLLVEYRQLIYDDNDPNVNVHLAPIDDILEFIEYDLKVNQP